MKTDFTLYKTEVNQVRRQMRETSYSDTIIEELESISGERLDELCEAVRKIQQARELMAEAYKMIEAYNAKYYNK